MYRGRLARGFLVPPLATMPETKRGGMMRYWRAYVRWFDHTMSGDVGLIIFAIGIVLWTLMLTDRPPF
jgi:hypothetical protein